VNAIIKRRFAAAGLDPEDFSGHSLRAGFVTSALIHGGDLSAAADHARLSAAREAVFDP